MSQTRKKTVKKKATAIRTKKKAGAKASSKSSPAKVKASRKKAAAPRATSAKKATPKKTAVAKKKTVAAKAAPKKTAAKKAPMAKAKKAAKPSAPVKTEEPLATPKSEQQTKADEVPATLKKRAPRSKPIPLSQTPHPKFGLKFECFRCQAKFYDLGKPDPICPKCATDQRDRPRAIPKKPLASGRRLGDHPIVPLLDDEDEITTEVVSFEDAGEEVVPTPRQVDMFDDADDASADDEEIFDDEEHKLIRHPLIDDSEEL